MIQSRETLQAVAESDGVFLSPVTTLLRRPSALDELTLLGSVLFGATPETVLVLWLPLFPTAKGYLQTRRTHLYVSFPKSTMGMNGLFLACIHTKPKLPNRKSLSMVQRT